MSDLISRSALLEYGNARTIKEAVGNWDELDGKAKAAVLRYAIKIKTVINHAPAVDAVPVVHGRWIKIGVDEFVCSACGGYVEYESQKCGYKYCHHCGAKMYGGKDNATD